MMDPKKGESSLKKNNVRKLVSIAMLSSIAYILMFLNFPVPPFPAFLKIDFSDLPALIGAIIFGPMAGVLIELMKNVLDYFIKGSETGVPVGHIANFLAGLLYILPIYYVYNKVKSKKGMTVALVLGSFVMAVVMSILNYLVILPAYTFFLGMPAMSGPEVRQYIVAGILPFNLIKGIAMSVLFMLLFTRMGTWMNKQATAFYRLNG
jgi:riboflavin transporter